MKKEIDWEKIEAETTGGCCSGESCECTLSKIQRLTERLKGIILKSAGFHKKLKKEVAK